MNVGAIKAFLGDQPPAAHPEQAIKKQLQQEGLRQAAEFQQQHNAVSVNSTSVSIGLKVVSSSLEKSVELDGQKATTSAKTLAEKNESAFDFKAVANNVMRFVGGVIRGAADSGASDDKLTDLFSQARSGVAKGISMAERDLGGMMNSDIAEGIKNTRNTIEYRMTELENDIFGRKSIQEAGQSLGVAAAEGNSGSMLIRTRDGDELTIRFESFRQFEVRQQSYYSAPVEPVANGDGASVEQPQQTFQQSLSAQFFERYGFSFSLSGELDEGELKAIADLIGNASELADRFYRGDIESAFKKALELGYDDKELVGYSLQLNRTQSAEVVQAYESIQHYKDQSNDKEVKPVAQYLDKMLDVMNQATQLLSGKEDYTTLVNGLVNQMEDVQVPDLLSAINRFHQFNSRLLDAMPQGKAEPVETKPES